MPRAAPDAIRNMITIWYFTASTGLSAGEDLTGHHPGQTDDSDDHHRVDGRDQPGPDRLLNQRAGSLPAGRPQSQERLDLVPATRELTAQPVESERDAVERVAQDHPEQGDGILRRVPGTDPHDDAQRQRRHQPGARPDRGNAPDPDSRVPDLACAGWPPPPAIRVITHISAEHNIPSVHPEDPLQHESDEQQLDNGADRGEQQPALQPELEQHRERPVDQDEQRREADLEVREFEIQLVHVTAPAPGARNAWSTARW